MNPRLAICFFVLIYVPGASANARDVIELPQPSESSLRSAISQIAERRASGDTAAATITLPAGTYRFQTTLILSPEIVGDGLALKAGDKGEVIFSGAQRLSARPDSQPKRWRYRLPTTKAPHGDREIPRALLVDGELRWAARFPNRGYLRVGQALADRRSGFIVGNGDLPANWSLAGKLCDLVLLHDWSSSRIPVASYDPASHVIRTLGPIGCEAKHYAIDHFEKRPRYWLEGHEAFADEPGEWFYDASTDELVVIGATESSEPPLVELPILTTILSAAASSGAGGEATIRGLVLDSIVFAGSAFPMPRGGLAGGQATMHEARRDDGSRDGNSRSLLAAAVDIRDGVRCSVQNCVFRDLGSTALWIGQRSQRCNVTRCKFTHVGGNAINLGEGRERRVSGKSWSDAAPDQVASGNKISDCRIDHCGQMLPGAVAIWAGLTAKTEITNNAITDCPYTGISIGWVWDSSVTPARENSISKNTIQFVMQVLSDGAGIYTLGRQPGSKIENNLITDVPLNAGRAESNGVFADEGTTGLTVQGNTFRRIDRSPVRFHKAGKNTVTGNRWQLATDQTLGVRFNATPESNIEIADSQTLEPETNILAIGNSLTWDTKPPSLSGNVHWHVDCGKSLTYIRDHPGAPCVASSRLWPIAMATTQYDFVAVQPHYGTTVDEDVEVISGWVQQQQQAVFVIHTGWAKHEQFQTEWADTDPTGPLTHSDAHTQALLDKLRTKFPDRSFRCTQATRLLAAIERDIRAGHAPIDNLSDLYRDAIHMKIDSGRFLMHNAMRQALNQPLVTEWPQLDNELKEYLLTKLTEPRQIDQ